MTSSKQSSRADTRRGEPVRGARRTRASWFGRAGIWASRHAQGAFAAVGNLVRNPGTSGLTAAVIAIALSIPAAMYLVLENLAGVTGALDETAQISLFLNLDSTDADAQALAQRLSTGTPFTAVGVITRDEALREYEQMLGLSEGSAVFGPEDNPLPPVVVLTLPPDQKNPDEVTKLVANLQLLPEVEMARFDMEWMSRLAAGMQLLRRAVAVLALLLGAGIALVVGNTVRLGVEQRQQEIEVAKLCGATDAFVRRPFLYTGLLYGLAGGVCAWLLIFGAVEGLRGPADRLVALYGSERVLRGLDVTESLALLAVGILVGWISAWITVEWRIRRIEP